LTRLSVRGKIDLPSEINYFKINGYTLYLLWSKYDILELDSVEIYSRFMYELIQHFANWNLRQARYGNEKALSFLKTESWRDIWQYLHPNKRAYARSKKSYKAEED